jgi:hypothetical protein
LVRSRSSSSAIRPTKIVSWNESQTEIQNCAETYVEVLLVILVVLLVVPLVPLV